MPESQRSAALDRLSATLTAAPFLEARRAALGVARHRRITRPRAKSVDAAEAAVAADDEALVKATLPPFATP